MSRRKDARRGSHRRQVPPAGRRPGVPSRPLSSDAQEPNLLADVGAMLLEDHPLGLLWFASSLLAAVDHREANLAAADRDHPDAGPDLNELVRSFLAVDRVETTALLEAIRELVPDELLAKRIDRGLAPREHALPDWLTRLQPLRIDDAMILSHALGEGDSVFVGVRTGSGHELSVVVYIDHNLGTIVKDAFVVDEALDSVVARYRELADDDPDMQLVPIDLADARAHIDDGVAGASAASPPFETDTWPASQPLIAWVVRQLPVGGTGYTFPEWGPERRQQLISRFLTSPGGAPFDDLPGQGLLETLLWFACDHGKGDPLRWGPITVEILLTDWLHRNAPPANPALERAPELLRHFIRFVHAESGISDALTDQALAAVDACEPTYHGLLRAGRPPVTELLDAMGCWDDRLDGIEVEADRWDEEDFRAYVRASLADAVGGYDALDTLDARPLPDEPFDWAVVPEDVRAPVEQVLTLVDEACGALLDREHRTACRRLLAAVAEHGPHVLRRKGRPETAAAAIAWSVAKANDTFELYHGLQVKELLGWFGLTGSVSQRANTLLDAAGIPDARPYGIELVLRSPRYLTGPHRADIIRTRDRIAPALD